MPLNAALIGKEYEADTYEVTADAIEKYARATNDLNERYIGGDDVVASPIFPIVPAFQFLMKAGMDPELEADLLRLVHGEEEHVLQRPIRPGDKLTLAPVIESIEQKDTGETFTVKVTEANQDGDVVAVVRATSFIRGTGSGARPPTRPGSTNTLAEREIVYEEATKVDDDQTYRYAEASGDHNPIHVDENVAKMAGLPGIINHGMCTMAIATKGAVNGLAGGDPTRVTRVAVRFSKLVFPGQELTTKFWREGSGDGTTNYGFETYNPDGEAVIKNATVEIADA
ncbi:MAG: MaoC family dehydratase N-terminal domain-containing protein [Actinomycetota bacterium]|nr:MaoC family dehydratase N-terminal domain-containing protein [Actinomycetota bacterium]